MVTLVAPLQWGGAEDDVGRYQGPPTVVVCFARAI